MKYFFTMLVHLLGPVKNVRGRGIKIKDHRVIEKGPRKNEKINVETPTSYVASLEFENGTKGMALNLEQDSVGAVVLGDYLEIIEGQKD